MPTSRERKPKHERPVSRRNDSVLAGSSTGTFAPGFDGPGWRKAMSALDNPELPPDLLVVSIVPILWTGVMRGRPANVCVSACEILHYAYEQVRYSVGPSSCGPHDPGCRGRRRSPRR